MAQPCFTVPCFFPSEAVVVLTLIEAVGYYLANPDDLYRHAQL
jgi:hypothetical protein